MSEDIVERLNAFLVAAVNHDGELLYEEHKAMRDAVHEIIRLRAECGAWVMKNAALHKEIAQLRRVLTES